MVTTTMKAPALSLWRMTRVRYDRLVDVGIFGPEDRVELLDGLLVAREPKGGVMQRPWASCGPSSIKRLAAPTTFARKSRSRSTTDRSPSPTSPSCAGDCATTGSPILLSPC